MLQSIASYFKKTEATTSQAAVTDMSRHPSGSDGGASGVPSDTTPPDQEKSGGMSR